MKNKYRTVDVTTLSNGVRVMVNCYWLCKNGDPTKAIFYGSVPQCNINNLVTRKLLKYTAEQTGWDVDVVYIDIAYIPV